MVNHGQSRVAVAARYALLLLALACVTEAGAPYCMPNQSCYPNAAVWSSFAASLKGQLLTPSSSSWDTATKLKNPRLTSFVPAALVQAQTASDVIATVAFVKQHNLLLSVKSTGHCYTGNCQAKSSLNLDLSGMIWFDADLASMTAAIGPGTVFETIYSECHNLGVLAVGGMCPTVGMVGYSLGGGHGPLIRSFGLGADNIVDITLVTANATLVTASSGGTVERALDGSVTSTSPSTDLWWALRGGGGGTYGVVVNMTIKLHAAPKDPLPAVQCYFPMVVDGGAGLIGPQVLQHYFEVSETLASEWGIFLSTLKSPVPFNKQMPKWNSSLHGLIVLDGLYLGSSWGDAVSSIASITEFHPEWQLKCGLTNMSSFKEWHDTRWFGKGMSAFREYMTSNFPQQGPSLNAAQLAQVVVNRTLAKSPLLVSFNAFFGILAGGAVSQVPQASSAISPAFRNARMVLEADGSWIGSWNDEAEMAWVAAAAAEMGAVAGVEGSYVNEASPALSDWQDEFWGATNFARLQAVKHAWDPTSVFTCEHCVYA